MSDNIDDILKAIKDRYSQLSIDNDVKIDFINHLRSIARWHNEPMDYPEIKDIKFPDSIHVAYAVCHPECGAREFIVDGSTQECQRCGSLMYRTEVVEYRLMRT